MAEDLVKGRRVVTSPGVVNVSRIQRILAVRFLPDPGVPGVGSMGSGVSMEGARSTFFCKKK